MGLALLIPRVASESEAISGTASSAEGRTPCSECVGAFIASRRQGDLMVSGMELSNNWYASFFTVFNASSDPETPPALTLNELFGKNILIKDDLKLVHLSL